MPRRIERDRRTWVDAFVANPDQFDRRRRLRRQEDARGDLSGVALLSAGFFGGIAVGGLVWEALIAGNRRGLFSDSRLRRYAAVSYLAGRPSVGTARLLREYVRRESHPLLRRHGRRALRSVLGALDAAR